MIQQEAAPALWLTRRGAGSSVRRMRRALVPLLMMGLLSLTGCPPKYPACNGDKDCHPGEYCVNNQCQQCRDSNDCPKGQECKGGRCEAGAPKSCSGDADCPGHQSVVDGACKPCARDDQCGERGECQRGRCKRAQSLPKPPIDDAITQ